MRFSLFSPTPHRACDFHRTRRSLGDLSPTWGHCSDTHYKCHHNFDLYFSAPIQLLIVLRQFTSFDVRYISPFQQSYPSHIPLGACYGTDDLFDSLSYASPYLAASSTCIAAWTVSLYFAGSSDRNGHTHHGYFMDHRHISWLHESTFCRLHRASHDLTFVIYRMSEFMVDIPIYRIVSSPAISCSA